MGSGRGGWSGRLDLVDIFLFEGLVFDQRSLFGVVGVRVGFVRKAGVIGRVFGAFAGLRGALAREEIVRVDSIGVIAVELGGAGFVESDGSLLVFLSHFVVVHRDIFLFPPGDP